MRKIRGLIEIIMFGFYAIYALFRKIFLVSLYFFDTFRFPIRGGKIEK